MTTLYQKLSGIVFAIGLAFIIITVVIPASAATVAFYDFRLDGYNWNYVTDNGSITNFEFGENGMSFTVIGEDPHVWSPAQDYPDDKPVGLYFCMKSTAGTAGQIFYGQTSTMENSTNFTVINDGLWHDYEFELPALGAGAMIRIDPCHNQTGDVTIAWVQTQADLTNSTLITWDFRTGFNGWSGNFDVSDSVITSDGWSFISTGIDPWLNAPPTDYPSGNQLTFIINMKSSADNNGKFYYAPNGEAFSEDKTVNFTVIPDGQFHEYYVPFPALGPAYNLRFDPGTAPGSITVQQIQAKTISVTLPLFKKPSRPQPNLQQSLSISSGDLTLTHYRQRWGNFVLNVDGEEIASSHNADELGFAINDLYQFTSLTNALFSVTNQNDTLIEHAVLTDDGGGTWTLTRQFTPGTLPGTIDVQMQVECSQQRNVLHIPWLTLFPGLETYGTDKKQGLFAGLEYLTDEPSSSKKDLTTPQYLRRIPFPDKITFPLMTICQNERYFGVMWNLSDYIAAVYDTPDRVYHSDSQIMALWAPNAGELRNENYLTAHYSFILNAGSPLEANFVLTGGLGDSVVPALQNYVSLFGVPSQPVFNGGFDAAVELLSAGWTLSDGYDGAGRWRHAVWGSSFPFQTAADAVVYSKWLANHSTNSTIISALESAAILGKQKLDVNDPNYLTGVAHNSWPMRHFILGKIPEYLTYRLSQGFSYLSEFNDDGIRVYTHAAGRPDLSVTHWTNNASGYSATPLYYALEAAELTGNDSLINQAVAILDKQTILYSNSVPRGAQTWEIPLHTPDIMASAYLVGCYVKGYELTGRDDLLEQAKYWAWTGISFIYMNRSTSGIIGDFATIPVLGATQWVAPLWIGRPVQWCGLVYRNNLLLLSHYDSSGFWKQVADSITASGLQQTWPHTDVGRQGLLPDFFFVDTQHRDGPAINAGTLQTGLAELYGVGSLYGFHRSETMNWFIHVPSELEILSDTNKTVHFTTDGWGTIPYSILLSGVEDLPPVILSGVSGTPTNTFFVPQYQYLDGNGWLIITNVVGDTEFLVSAIPEPFHLLFIVFWSAVIKKSLR